ncbi:MAG: oxalate decarboxylase family bicupin [Thermomicrobiales bacterium]
MEDGDGTAADAMPEPREGDRGGIEKGPRDVIRERENPDLMTPPRTDSGTMPNLRFSFADAHMRLEAGGWTREITVLELPIATTLSGVQMGLNAGNPSGVREMHWHSEAEWAYMLNGVARITAIDPQGRNFVDDVGVGDLWYFPAGWPHSIQAHDAGCEFLLVFDDGGFSENSTFLLTDWFEHTPTSVLAKNFGMPESALAEVPPHGLYMFLAPAPGALSDDEVPSPAGGIPLSLTYRMSKQEPIGCSGGRVRIVDSTTFPISRTIAAALLEIEPGGMREMHWHPNADEWQYYLEGQARMTVFASSGVARTFDYRAGDVGYVPRVMGHYLENTGDGPLRVLEMFRSDRFEDVSLAQWLGLTPPELVQAHLHLSNEALARLPTTKPLLVK